MPLHGGRGMMKHKEPPVSVLMPVLLFHTYECVVSIQLLKTGRLLFSYYTFIVAICNKSLKFEIYFEKFVKMLEIYFEKCNSLIKCFFFFTFMQHNK